MARVKCKYCEQYLLRNDAEVIHETSINGKNKTVFLHKTCINDYKELMEYKENEIKWFNEIYEYIKALLGYCDEQKLPNFLITRIQDLRNGTVMQKGVGRIIKSKEGYEYPIILDTFLNCGDKIRWAITNKQFQNEKNKINYIMAIIESNINDIYIGFKNKLDIADIKKRDNIVNEEACINLISKNNKITQNNTISKGISKFLDEEDL